MAAPRTEIGARPSRSCPGSPLSSSESESCSEKHVVYSHTPSSTPIGALGNFVYNLANRFHLIPRGGADIESGGYQPVPGAARAEAERRRCVIYYLMRFQPSEQRSTQCYGSQSPRSADGWRCHISCWQTAQRRALNGPVAISCPSQRGGEQSWLP